MWYFCLVAQSYPTTTKPPLWFALPLRPQQPACRGGVPRLSLPPCPPWNVCARGAAQTIDSVSTSPCGPSFRDSFRTVGFSMLPLPPSPRAWEDRPFCSSLASSDPSG